MARAAKINVRGLARARDRLDLLGFRAYDQRQALAASAAVAPQYIRPRWKDDSGDLTASISEARNQHVRAASFTIVSDVFYSRFVFYGTKYTKRRPPLVRRKQLTAETTARVSKALVQ